MTYNGWYAIKPNQTRTRSRILRNVEYPFTAITPLTTLTKSPYNY